MKRNMSAKGGSPAKGGRSASGGKRFDIITIFPKILDSYFNESLFKRGQENKLFKIKTHNLRQWTKDRHQTVDDRLYGGGAGLLFKAEPIIESIKSIKLARNASRSDAGGSKVHKVKSKNSRLQTTNHKLQNRTILTAANGKRFTQQDAVRLARYDQLIFVCPRYEGADARVEKFVDEKLSIGDYVLSGGELPAAVIIEAVARQVPGFVGKQESVAHDSHSQEGYLEHPHYTRPEVLVAHGKKLRVPKVLLSGHHAEVAKWREKKSKRSNK